ncbi:MAG: sporulation protein YunB [Oscillospiraceae bacterium]|nr:sporulation protein YunB [Oscillospiraceae bacterium]
MAFRKRCAEDISRLGLPRIRRRRQWWGLWVALGLFIAFALRVGIYLRSASASLALSEARDSVTSAVNSAVARVIREGNYGYGAFVKLEKDAAGNITAVITDAERVNLFAAEVLREITRSARSGSFDIRIPLGSLLGSDLLLGRGPEIPVRIGVNTSPELRFESGFSGAGINQTRHSLYLQARVEAEVYLPWSTAATVVDTSVLVTETILLGQVPGTYFAMEEAHGSQ